MLVTNKDLLLPAYEKAYAVGAFNVYNLESLLGVIEAAVEEESPAIIAITPSAIKYAGLAYLSAIVRTASELTPIPISLHLDHGDGLEVVSKCIDNGFTSVMIDGSFLEFKDNVSLTKKVVDIAHPKGVSVEAELGRITGVEEKTVEEKESALTDPNMAREFVKSTSIDALAVAIGTSHGAYKFKTEPKLDFTRLELIKEKIHVPLVLHGASSVPSWIVKKASKYGAQLSGAKGIPEEHIKRAISLGVTKINIDTDLRLAFIASIREFLIESPKEFDPRKILRTTKDAIKEIVKNKIQLFGSSKKI